MLDLANNFGMITHYRTQRQQPRVVFCRSVHILPLDHPQAVAFRWTFGAMVVDATLDGIMARTEQCYLV
jgi:hypothetical protein